VRCEGMIYESWTWSDQTGPGQRRVGSDDDETTPDDDQGGPSWTREAHSSTLLHPNSTIIIAMNGG